MAGGYYNDFPKIRRRLQTRGPQLVQKTLFDVEAIAKTLSRFRTGAMRAGWRVIYRAGALIGQVGNNVEYAVHHEYGTRFMAAQPMARPAIAKTQPGYLAAWRALLKGLTR